MDVANQSLNHAADTAPRLAVPILTPKLADYRGEADLLPMLRRALNRGGIELAELSVRATLQASDADFVLLLDGLNEVSLKHAAEVLSAIRRHSDEFYKHRLRLTCRTADFDF